jgi:predicted enzyme related to lactoylglutathione lyase
MKRVTGIGGVFFKSQDPKQLKGWYQEHLGITPDKDGHIQFDWREKDDPERVGFTVWEPFEQNTDYFNPSTKPFMFNFRVANLTALLEQLRKEGVEVDDKVEEYEYGKFGWVMDPEGNRVELWEPPQ